MIPTVGSVPKLEPSFYNMGFGFAQKPQQENPIVPARRICASTPSNLLNAHAQGHARYRRQHLRQRNSRAMLPPCRAPTPLRTQRLAPWQEDGKKATVFLEYIKKTDAHRSDGRGRGARLLGAHRNTLPGVRSSEAALPEHEKRSWITRAASTHATHKDGCTFSGATSCVTRAPTQAKEVCKITPALAAYRCVCYILESTTSLQDSHLTCAAQFALI